MAKGKYLGVRKLANGVCNWIARLRDDDGKQHYRPLGQATEAFGFHAAKRAAEAWFADFDVGVTDKPLTVAEACREYVQDLEAEGREDTAHDAQLRFQRTIYSDPMANVLVEKLRTERIKQWRNGLGGAKSSQNRNLASFKAALNLAVAHRRVNPAVAQEWRAVKKLQNATNRRTLFLDLGQRRALLSACDGALRDLVEAAMLTGSRPGELVRMKRSQFDARTATATFNGKTGPRAVPLSPAATSLFKRLAKGKLPGAAMFTRDDGKAWAHSDWDELLRAAATAAELPKDVVLYTMRHSFITEALRGGMATLDVARLTGTSLPMIQEHYGHLVAEAARERLALVTMI
jgi:integrase